MHEKHPVQTLRVQTVFLMINPWGSKHVEDVKSRIKALILSLCISLFILHKGITMHGAKRIKYSKTLRS